MASPDPSALVRRWMCRSGTLQWYPLSGWRRRAGSARVNGKMARESDAVCCVSDNGEQVGRRVNSVSDNANCSRGLRRRGTCPTDAPRSLPCSAARGSPAVRCEQFEARSRSARWARASTPQLPSCVRSHSPWTARQSSAARRRYGNDALHHAGWCRDTARPEINSIP